MNPEQELLEALAQADAAGDVVSAQKIAGRIKAMRAEASIPTQQDNIDQMSGFDKAAVAVGRGFNDVGQGVKQAGLELGEYYDKLPGFLKATNPLLAMNARAARNTGQSAAEYTQQVQGELADYAPLQQDSPVLTSVGRIVGNVAALPIPAGGATAGGRIAAGAGVGALQGGAQFVPEGGSRGGNAALGAAIGGLVPGLIEGGRVTVGAVKKLASGLRGVLPNVTQAAREQTAARILQEAAANPANLAKAGQSGQFVAGTQQTLAEATDDRGIAALQNTLANLDGDFKNKLGELATKNNAARVSAIQGGFGGADEASAKAIEAVRDRTTLPILAAARKVRGVDTKPVVKLADRIIKAREGNDTVVSVVSKVRDILARDGMDDIQKLHNVRQEIGNVLSGQTDSTQAGRAAASELMSIKKALDAQMGKASPEFRQFLKQYSALSDEAGRVRIGEELLNKSAASLDAMGNPVLSPAKFAGAAKDLDRVAKAATGFRKETADRLMTPDQKALVGNIRADLDRVARVGQAGTAIGSNTAQNLERAGALRSSAAGIEGDVKQMALSSVPLVGKVLDRFNQYYGEKVMGIVREAALDPNRAQMLLAKLPPAQQQQVISALRDPQIIKAIQSIGPAAAAAASTGE